MEKIPFTNLPCGCDNRKETLSKVNMKEAAVFGVVLVLIISAGFYLRSK